MIYSNYQLHHHRCLQTFFSSSFPCFNYNIIILFYGLTSWKKLLYLKDAVGICYRTRDYVHGIQEGNIGICIHKGRSQRVAKSTCPSQKLFYIAQQGGLHVFAGVLFHLVVVSCVVMTAAAGHEKRNRSSMKRNEKL